MQSLVVMLLFIGMFMVVHGIYDEKLRSMKDNVRVEYRFVPRTFYEEQLSQNPTVAAHFKGMFQDPSPWESMNHIGGGSAGSMSGAGNGSAHAG